MAQGPQSLVDVPPQNVRPIPTAPVNIRQFLQFLSLLLVLADWYSFWSWGVDKLPLMRMNAAHLMYVIMLVGWAVTFNLYRRRMRTGFDFDDAWYDYVVAILVGSALCGLCLKWLENPFADESRHFAALTMSTGYVALSAFATIRPPGKSRRGLVGTIAPVIQLPVMYLFHITEANYMTLVTLFSLTIYTLLMLGVREYIQRVADRSHLQLARAQQELAISEAARRDLEIRNAVEVERQRLMSEVHDGIGSSLVTALAVARREGHSKPTVDLLSRAVSELKITVDSLDPMGGDLLALLGNLRHRLEPGFIKAGLAVKWDARTTQLLPWLDSANALQLLRLVQEAASNTLVHSGASQLTIRCAPATLNEREGVHIIVEDDGGGFDPSLISGGKGIASMQSRAAALGGILECKTAPQIGTKWTLWLPLDQRQKH